MIPRKTRHDKIIEKMVSDMEAALSNIDLGQDTSFATTDKRDPRTGFFDRSEASILATPDEAWVTKDQLVYQIYARRVIQYTILCLNGPRFNDMVDLLRSATIVTILEKYQSLLISLGWNTMFFPPAILDVLCRRERGQTLTPAAERQCDDVTQVLVGKCEFRSTGTVAYTHLTLPTIYSE